MSTKRSLRKKDVSTREEEDWYSDVGSEDNWKSERDWNGGGSSLAGEASGVSEGTDEEQPDEDEYKFKSPKKNNSKEHTYERKRFDWDDVGTDDEGDSRHPEDVTERSEKYSKTNISDVSDMSDIEEQISEAQSKFNDDRQSLSSVMGLVDEVTIKGENLARKASQTNITVDKENFKTTALLRDKFNMLEDDEMSYQSYDEPVLSKSDVVGKEVVGRIEYMAYEEPSKDVQPECSQNIEKDGKYDGIMDQHSGDAQKEEERDPEILNEEMTEEASSCISDTKTDRDTHSTKSSHRSIKSAKTQSSSSHKSKLSASTHERNAEQSQCGCGDELSQKDVTDDEAEILIESPNEFEDPECAKIGHQHLCCFLAIGGGGDGSKDVEIVNRLKKLKDDIARMREELSLARKECKKESEEVARLIEEAAARNKAAEEDMTLLNIATPPSTPPDPFITFKDIQPRPTLIVPPVPIPTTVLENRLRATRQNASSTYRASLDQLERMVEKEMASIQDSMTRLEPLNKMAAEWDAYQPLRPMTYKRDYRMEMVSSEMRLKTVDGTKM